MNKKYLHVEAVNLSNFVYDTHDVSTIRGGSYLLLTLLQEIPERFPQLITVTNAASQGLFTFDGTESSASNLQRAVLQYLHDGAGGHATFLAAVCDDIPDDQGGFPLVLQRLQAQIRRQQWRMPTIAVPESIPTADECYIDGWRPASTDPSHRQVADDLATAFSKSTYFRRSQGRALRRTGRVFRDSGVDIGSLAFTDDLTQLSGSPGEGVPGLLGGKMAVIHVDGNAFGKNRGRLCLNEGTRTEFDDYIQVDLRGGFLEKLLNYARNTPSFLTTDKATGQTLIRLEILLWGGDEMTLIVPAWQAWQTLWLYYDHTTQAEGFQGEALTHRGAVVFCHHDSPILMIRDLLESLLDRAKKSISENISKADLDAEERAFLQQYRTSSAYADAFHYLVLESFDLLQGSLDAFLDKYYKKAAYGSLLISANEITTLSQILLLLRQFCTRNKLLQIISIMQNVPDDTVSAAEAEEAGHKSIQKITDKMIALVPVADREGFKAAIDSLTQNQQNLDRWYLLTDLWDYIPTFIWAHAGVDDE